MAWTPDPNNRSHYIGGTDFMFRPLNDLEEEAFREHARLNDPGDTDLSVLHPVCREEWEKRECPQCCGIGKVPMPDALDAVCPTCEGKKYITTTKE